MGLLIITVLSMAQRQKIAQTQPESRHLLLDHLS